MTPDDISSLQARAERAGHEWAERSAKIFRTLGYALPVAWRCDGRSPVECIPPEIWHELGVACTDDLAEIIDRAAALRWAAIVGASL